MGRWRSSRSRVAMAARRLRSIRNPAGADAPAAHLPDPGTLEKQEATTRRGRADTVFLYGTIVDHAAAPDPDPQTQSRVEYLASLSRLERL